MKKGFTLLEMLIVVVVLSILMGIVFRLGSLGSDSNARVKTVFRLQCLENCLSGYYAAFGSYPPVTYHGSPNPHLAVNNHGIQRNEEGGDIFSDSNEDAADQIEAACRAQPVACNFPFPQGYAQMITILSDGMKEQIEKGTFDEQLKNDQTKKNKLLAGFDDGGSGSGATGRFSGNKDKVKWSEIQLFRFGLMSYLLPRYLVMMCGADDFYSGDFRQWSDNNTIPSNPLTGSNFSSWSEIKRRKENYEQTGNKNDLASLANIPSQAVCARWLPNLANICACNREITLFGINIQGDINDSQLSASNLEIPIYSPSSGDSDSTQDQYILDGITILDGWGKDFYYHSPSPHQKYTLWSAGPNKRTFPPWISRKTLRPMENERVVEWTHDDIVHLSH